MVVLLGLSKTNSRGTSFPRIGFTASCGIHLVETGPEEPRDLLDEGIGGQEGVVTLRQLLHLLLVLVQLLQVVSRHAGQA